MFAFQSLTAGLRRSPADAAVTHSAMPLASSGYIVNGHPAEAPATVHRSTHEIVNAEVRDLGVVCVGVEGTRLFFEVTRAIQPSEMPDLMTTIIQRLGQTPEPARTVLKSITSLTVTVHAPE
jgi:hypothetical protein